MRMSPDPNPPHGEIRVRINGDDQRLPADLHLEQVLRHINATSVTPEELEESLDVRG